MVLPTLIHENSGWSSCPTFSDRFLSARTSAKDKQGKFLHNLSCRTQRNMDIICGGCISAITKTVLLLHVWITRLIQKASCIYDKSLLGCLKIHQVCFVKCQSLYFSEFPKDWYVFAWQHHSFLWCSQKHQRLRSPQFLLAPFQFLDYRRWILAYIICIKQDTERGELPMLCASHLWPQSWFRKCLDKPKYNDERMVKYVTNSSLKLLFASWWFFENWKYLLFLNLNLLYVFTILLTSRMLIVKGLLAMSATYFLNHLNERFLKVNFSYRF